jgi:hypothetical protein
MSTFVSPSKSPTGPCPKVTTVNAAALLVAEPALLVATRRYRKPLNPAGTPVTVSAVVVAPL